MQLVIKSLETPKSKNEAHLAIFRFSGTRFFSGALVGPCCNNFEIFQIQSIVWYGAIVHEV